MTSTTLDQKTVEELLLDTFGLDVNKSRFILERWNASWSDASKRNEEVKRHNDKEKEIIEKVIEKAESIVQSIVPSPPSPKDEGFKQVPQKFTSFSRSMDYYIGRESTDRDTEKQFDSWKMIKRSFECLDARVQSQRNHFGVAPERDLDFAQASICPTETRQCTLKLDSNATSSRYVITSAGASWDIALNSTTVSTTVRKSTETFLGQVLDAYPSLFSFFRRQVAQRKMRLESMTSIAIKNEKDLFSDSEHYQTEFLKSNGFCIQDEEGKILALATCKKDEFDPSISLNLSDDDAIDCSHLPFYGSNFSEEDKFEFASKAGLLLFVWSSSRKHDALASILSLVLIEANAENPYVSVSVKCDKSLCAHLSQTLGFFRTFYISRTPDSRADEEMVSVYDSSKAPPVECDMKNPITLFRIFPSASQILGSALLIWMQLEVDDNQEVLKSRVQEQEVLTTTKKKVPEPRQQKSLSSQTRKVKKDEDSLTTIENSADRFNRTVNVWKGSIDSLRNQLVEEE